MDNSLPAWLSDHRMTVLVGHSGSGKTELAVNMSVALARAGERTALADLDIVDPYFRSRERRALFDSLGIRFVASSQSLVDADVPALPAELNALLQDGALRSILDIGGDLGARVLARYRHQIAVESHRVVLVLNARRPQTNTPEKAISCIRRIEAAMGLPVDGMVNNTHLCGETKASDVLLGAELAGAVSLETDIPVVCHAAVREITGGLLQLRQPVFPMDIYMKKPWEL